MLTPEGEKWKGCQLLFLDAIHLKFYLINHLVLTWYWADAGQHRPGIKPARNAWLGCRQRPVLLCFIHGGLLWRPGKPHLYVMDILWQFTACLTSVNSFFSEEKTSCAAIIRYLLKTNTTVLTIISAIKRTKFHFYNISTGRTSLFRYVIHSSGDTLAALYATWRINVKHSQIS